MNVEYSFELKRKAYPNLLITGKADNEAQAIENYNQAIEKWEGANPPPVATNTKPKPTAVPNETPAESEPVQAETKPVAAGRDTKRFNQQLSDTALSLLGRASIVVADFRGLHPLDISKKLGFKLELAVMTASDLQSVINQTRDALTIYGNNHKPAQAYLEMADLFDTATSVAELDEKKSSFTRGRDLSADEYLFNEAKSLYLEKKVLLQTADFAAAS